MSTVEEAKAELAKALVQFDLDHLLRALAKAGCDVEIRIKDREPPGGEGRVTVITPPLIDWSGS